MSAPWERFTTEQRVAAVAVDRGLAAAAGAGAGKTAVMAVRYCCCLLDRDAAGRRLMPDRLLAITFTREAVGNLRGRIDRMLRIALRSGSIADAAGSRPLDHDEVEHLRACLNQLPQAPICTYDALCLQLVAAHAAPLAQDPDVQPAEELQLRQARQRAWQRLRSDWLAEDAEGLVACVQAFGERGLREAVQRDADRLAALPERRCAAADEDPVAALIAAHAQRLTVIDELVAQAQQAATGKTAEALAGIVPLLPLRDEPWQLARVVGDLYRIRHVGPAKALLKEIRAELAAPEAPASFSGVRFSSNLVALCVWDPDREADALHLAQVLAPRVLAYREALLSELASDGISDYARFEEQALRLLADESVRRRLRERYRHCLLDEAQDFNRLQGAFVEALAGDGDGPRVFVVGDERQSIYGFRHAAPALFRRWCASVPGGGEGVVLAENFRSHPDLVAALKRRFDAPSLSESFQVAGIAAGRDAGDWSSPALCAAWEMPLEEGEQARQRQVSERLAAHTAQLIATSMGEGRAAGEHAILLRNRSRMRLYAQALERQGIPFDTDFPSGLYTSQEAHDVEAVIRLALLRNDRYALAVAGGGPWGSADAQDRSAYDAIFAAEDPWAVAAVHWPDLAEVVTRCGAVLQREGPAGAIRLLAHDARLTGRYAQLPLARRRYANLIALAAAAQERDDDAVAWLHRLAHLRRHGVDEAEASGAALGARGVRLLTVHRSKGLQWPVVILPECHAPFSSRDHASALLSAVRDECLTIACQPPSEEGKAVVLRHAALAAQVRDEQVAEEARLFYVACTRAEHRLICLRPEAKRAGDAAQAGCWGDWIDDWQMLPDTAPAAPAAASDAVAPLGELTTAPSDRPRVVAVTALADIEQEPAADAAVDLERRLAQELGTALHAALARFGPGMAAHQAAMVLQPFAAALTPERQSALHSALTDAALVPDFYQGGALREQALLVRHETADCLLRGDCDVIVPGEDAWTIYDYKSGGAADSASARFQLACYAAMLRRARRDVPAVAACIIDLETRRRIAVDVDDDAAAWGEAGRRAAEWVSAAAV